MPSASSRSVARSGMTSADEPQEHERRRERVGRAPRARPAPGRRAGRRRRRARPSATPFQRRLGEEADEEDAGEAGDAVGGEHVERLVDPRPRPPDDDGVARQRGERAEHHRPRRADVARRRGDPDAADDDRGRRADRRHLPAAQQVERRTRRPACRPGVSSVFVNASTLGLPVENPLPPLKPNQPNHSRPGAEQHVDRVVRQQRLAPVVLARADDQRRGQRREAGAHLDRDAAGEVERPARLQPAAAERPVREHRVDEHRPQRREDEERRRSASARRRRPTRARSVTMQNVAWKAMKSRCGIVVPSRGAKATSCRNAWPRPPMSRRSPSNASE